mgnify:CR=1 FL=1|tara:strand:+ start:3313 stop:3942 length:630 start_codon:yes stop_codon:yes gene_type:complete
MAQGKENRIQWIYSSRDSQELLERYDQWAEDYDVDVMQTEEYKGTEVAAGFFTKCVPRNARVLDAGAGTGLMGEALTRLGYSDIVAIDLSQGMLDIAARKKAYKELYQMALGERLDFETDSFDAVVSTGVFTAAHAPASSFHELVRVTRRGGHIVFTLSDEAYEGSGFKETLDALESDGKWELLEKSESQKLTKDSTFEHKVWTYQVAS